MADTVSKIKRSQVMAAVRSKGNKGTELRLIGIFRKSRVTGWRRHLPLPGRPDFVFTRERVAVFVDGCFWHGCSDHCRMPKTRLDYWNPKIDRNRRRDDQVNALLRSKGWRVHRIWQHSLTSPDQVVMRLRTALLSPRS